MKILLVDDDKFLLSALSTYLEGLGHEVVLAQDGIRALDELEKGVSFDAIITDMNMPHMSGIELLQAIWREDNAIPTLLHSSESTGYMREGEGRKVVNLQEVVGYFDFATFHLKNRKFDYIDTFLVSVNK